MKAKIISIAVSSLCISSFVGPAQAEDYYSSQTPGGYVSTNSGYSSSNSGYSSSGTPAPVPVPNHKRDHNKKFSISVNLKPRHPTYIVTPPPQPIFVSGPSHHGFKGSKWIDMMQGYPLPADAVIGGGERNQPSPFFVCRGSYGNGMHPGKLIAGKCNISWGGREISLSQYQVLVSRYPLNWVSASNGFVPPNALEGGYENGGPLYVCQAEYRGGMHTGKIFGQACDIGWGGREVSVPYYNVLVR